MKVFLAPRSNETSYKNFLSTIKHGVPYERVEPFLTTDNKTLLSMMDKFYAWGNQIGKKSSWEKMNGGDIVLFYVKGRFLYWGTVLFTQFSEQLSDALWRRGSDGPWPCVFFLKDIKKIDIPISVVRELGGYEKTWDRVQGFMPLRPVGMQRIIERYESVHAFLDSPVEQLALDTVNALTEEIEELPEKKLQSSPRKAEVKRLKDVSKKEVLKLYTRDETKLGKANKTHQDLVDAFIEFYKDKKIECKEDPKSYDLLTKIGKVYCLFEMKSTNHLNAQLLRAVSQLLKYEYFVIKPMLAPDEEIKKCIVLDKKLSKLQRDFLSYLNILVFSVENDQIDGPIEEITS